MEKYKTVIIGAGPAGLRCAKILAENKENFLLLEGKKSIERKICTGIWGISYKTNYMALPDTLFQRKFNKVVLLLEDKKLEVIMNKPFVATVNREELGEWMYKVAKKSGANILFNHFVSEVSDDYVTVKNKRKIFFEYLVGADGSNSIVRKKLNLRQQAAIGIQYWIKGYYDNMELHLNYDKFGPWYAWIAPHKEQFSIGAVGASKIVSLAQIKKNLESWCREKNINFSPANFECAPINYDYQGYRFGNKFLIGDAAGFTSGLTGEGIYFAMASGEDVAKMIINYNYKPTLIKKILEIKRKHEIIAKTFENKNLRKIELKALYHLLKFNFFKKAIIELIA